MSETARKTQRAMLLGALAIGSAVGPEAMAARSIPLRFDNFSLTSLATPPNNADPALATWFRSLKTPNGTSCCDVADCRRASSRMTPTGYEVMIDGQWTPVPWERVLRRTDNPTGEAVVCYSPTEVETLIFCFVRPPDM